MKSLPDLLVGHMKEAKTQSANWWVQLRLMNVAVNQPVVRLDCGERAEADMTVAITLHWARSRLAVQVQSAPVALPTDL